MVYLIVHPSVAQLMTIPAWSVKEPPLGVITGVVALMTRPEAMLVTSLTVRPALVATHLANEPVCVIASGDDTTGVSVVGSVPSSEQRSSEPGVAEVTLMSATPVNVPSAGSRTVTGGEPFTVNLEL